ncbi:MAG: DUF4294 domain-containing protein [Candidatus Cryptobacteroides sp.]
MTKRIHILPAVLAAVLLAFACDASAQNRKEKMPEPKLMLGYEIVDGDTLFFDVLNPSHVTSFRKMKGREWRRYYRLVWNFSKTYPYALVARKLVEKTDTELEENDFNRRKREKYINSVQKELFTAFEEPLRGMTVSQGQLLMKLIDREVGKSSFFIIKDYKNGIAAGFWQGIAKLFGSDLKKHYDPLGEDKAVEELVQKWDSGEFAGLYFSIFGEYPKRIEIPSKYR